jgi:hypothetical protein
MLGSLLIWQETAMPHPRIEMNPEIMTGKPVIRGTRIPVELVLRKLGAGMLPESDPCRSSAVDAGGYSRRTGLCR